MIFPIAIRHKDTGETKLVDVNASTEDAAKKALLTFYPDYELMDENDAETETV